MVSVWFISTTANLLFCIIVSVVFTFTLNPGGESCSMTQYLTSATWVTFLLVPFVIWVFLSNGSIPRIRKNFIKSWAYWFPSLLSTSQKLLQQKNQDDRSLVSNVFNSFFDRWIVVSIVDVLFVFLVQFKAIGNHLTSFDIGDLIATFFQIWATGELFNATIDLFRGRHPIIAEEFTLNQVPQKVLVYFAGAAAIALIFILGFGVENDDVARKFIFFTLGLRFAIHVFQILSFTHLITVMSKFSNDLLDAVVTSVSISEATPARLDFPFRSANQINALRRSAGGNPNLSESAASVSEDGQPITSNADSVLLKGPRSDYSQVYKESEKIGDLLKMLSTLIFINSIYDVCTFIAEITVSFTGNDIVTRTLRLAMFLLPWIYLAGYRSSMSANATGNARACSVIFLVTTAYVISTIIGGYLGCAFLRSAPFSLTNGHSFLLYLAKASALPTTLSIAFVVLTSPGLRGWYALPWYNAFFLIPLIWLPPFVIQELHEASGANFVFMGLLHTVAWIIMVLVGMFDILQLGVFFAVVTGIVMLIFAVKLLWPPGQTIPFVNENSWSWYKSFDRFLRDSKYGSYHIYLAYSVMALFIVHGILKIGHSYSWYFLFLVFALIMMLRSHPMKRYQSTMATLGPCSARDRYEIISKTSTELRGKGLVAVTLVLAPPSNVDLEIFKGCGDIIVVQNLSVFSKLACLGKFYRTLETSHYFSVVSIDLDENPDGEGYLPNIRVVVMIQKTNRPDGASTAMVEERSAPGSNDKVLSDLRVIGFMKSNSLEALYSPCLIAFGYESGSAAFCSIFKERMRMRSIVETSVRRVKISELTDLCVIWCQFMKKPRGRALVSSDIVQALRQLVAMQEFLYSNSGGRGSKMLFVCTGVPPEWTPDPECIVHRTNPMEGEVATALGVRFRSQDRENERASWFSPPLSMFSDFAPGEQPGPPRQMSIADQIRNSVVQFVDWGLRPSSIGMSPRTTSVGVDGIGRKSSMKRFSLGKFGLSAVDETEGDTKSVNSSSNGVEMEAHIGESKSVVAAVSEPAAMEEGEQLQRTRLVTSKDSGISPKFPSQQSPDRSASPPPHGLATGHGEYTDQSPIVHGLPKPASNRQFHSGEDRLRDVRRSSLFSVPHHFTGIPLSQRRTPEETLIGIQSKEESWIPLRHALGSSWKTFRSILDYRIGSAINWLNHPGGPDYTSLFITEHQSDVPILRDFKYSEVYDEVNSKIIDHQLRYCKNPANYIAGQITDKEEPVDSATVACAVLYSGDYATAKRENLRKTVARIQEAENLTKDFPATLSFIPDA